MLSVFIHTSNEMKIHLYDSMITIIIGDLNNNPMSKPMLNFQVITGSHDCTIRLWDLAAGRSRVTLTNHKKSVRALALHPTQ